MTKLRHINISDIHISPYKEPSDYAKELTFILDYIDKIKEDINVLTIAGDLFEKVYPANHKAVHLAVEFMRNLYIRAKAYKFIIFLLKGTESHDSSQLDIFKGMECDGLFYIIRDVSFFDIKGLSFRFIPEYYSNSYQELYDKAFTTKTDVTVYHGGIEGAVYYLGTENNDDGMKKAQIIPKNDMIETVGLYGVCGHIHNRVNVSKNIWYTGSYTSKSFSDAGTIKGFDDIEIDIENYTYKCTFIENKLATRYRILNYTDVFKKPLRQIKAFFNELKLDTPKNEVLRIDIDVNNFSEEQMEFVSFISSSYKGFFQFQINREVVQKKNVSNILAEAEYVLSPNISIFDKIQKVISEEYEIDMDISRIKELLDVPTVTEEIVLESKTTE